MIGDSKFDQEIDNRWLVPYNKLLWQSINCHCNVELCMSIKYVLKYMYKGCDQAVFALQSSQLDEIADYQNARFVSSNEVAWRILNFICIHERDLALQQLAVHLENGQHVYFTEDIAMGRAIENLNSLHRVRWMTLPRLYCIWMSPNTLREVASLVAVVNKAQVWLAFQVNCI